MGLLVLVTYPITFEDTLPQAATYQTKDYWLFFIDDINVDNEAEAYLQALDILNTLQYRSGPSYSALAEAWVCFYSDEDYHDARALTPI